MKLSDCKTFTFSNGTEMPFYEVYNKKGSKKVFKVTSDNFELYEKDSINDKAYAPYLVKVAIDDQSMGTFNNLTDALEKLLNAEVEGHYENFAYLNTGKQLYNRLQEYVKSESTPLTFTVTIRHVVENENGFRIKYLLSAVHKVVKSKRKLELKSNAKKLKLQRQDAIVGDEDTLPVLTPDDIDSIISSQTNDSFRNGQPSGQAHATSH